jgi:hypothetical protein
MFHPSAAFPEPMGFRWQQNTLAISVLGSNLLKPISQAQHKRQRQYR